MHLAKHDIDIHKQNWKSRIKYLVCKLRTQTRRDNQRWIDLWIRMYNHEFFYFYLS